MGPSSLSTAIDQRHHNVEVTTPNEKPFVNESTSTTATPTLLFPHEMIDQSIAKRKAYDDAATCARQNRRRKVQILRQKRGEQHQPTNSTNTNDSICNTTDVGESRICCSNTQPTRQPTMNVSSTISVRIFRRGDSLLCTRAPCLSYFFYSFSNFFCVVSVVPIGSYIRRVEHQFNTPTSSRTEEISFE
jgi:hypothetical protein